MTVNPMSTPVEPTGKKKFSMTWTIVLAVILAVTLGSIAFATLRGLAGGSDTGNDTATSTASPTASEEKQKKGKATQDLLTLKRSSKVVEPYIENGTLYVSSEYYESLNLNAFEGVDIFEYHDELASIVQDLTGEEEYLFSEHDEQILPSLHTEYTASGLKYYSAKGCGPYFVSDEGIPFGYTSKELEVLNFTMFWYHAEPKEKEHIIEAYLDMHELEIQNLLESVKSHPEMYNSVAADMPMTVVGVKRYSMPPSDIEKAKRDGSYDIKRANQHYVYVTFEGVGLSANEAVPVAYYFVGEYQEKGKLYNGKFFPMTGLDFQRIEPIEVEERHHDNSWFVEQYQAVQIED